MDGLLVGRFQPFHLGHMDAIRFSLSRVDRLWLGLGSSNRPADRDNPFSAQEREEMILASIDSDTKKRVSIYPIPDLDDHVKWVAMIDQLVPKFQAVFSNDPLTGHLYSEREIEVIPIPFLDRENLSGTNIRGLIAGGKRWDHLVPEGTKDFLIRNGANSRLKSL